jgi:hypothetical protein
MLERAPVSSTLLAAAIVVVVGLTGVSAAGAAPVARKAPVRVTFVGDSVAASIAYTPAARAQLRRGLVVRLDLAVCRRLVQPSCSYRGRRPPSALDVVRSLGRSLGTVLVVKVGYNESAQGYREGIDEVMRAALAQGARGVVWVTLRETRDVYHWTNDAIRAAAKNWPQLVVADWNIFSSGKAWFGEDGLHLSAQGAAALAAFLRPYVLRAARGTA